MKLKRILYLVGFFSLSVCPLHYMLAKDVADRVREKGLGTYNFHVIYFNYKKDPANLELMPGMNLLFLDEGTEYKIAAIEGNLSRAFK